MLSCMPPLPLAEHFSASTFSEPSSAGFRSETAEAVDLDRGNVVRTGETGLSGRLLSVVRHLSELILFMV